MKTYLVTFRAESPSAAWVTIRIHADTWEEAREKAFHKFNAHLPHKLAPCDEKNVLEIDDEGPEEVVEDTRICPKCGAEFI